MLPVEVRKPPSTAQPARTAAEPPPQITVPTQTAQQAEAADPVDIAWVTIPAGEFLMGSDKKKDKQADDDEMPQHKIHLPEYRIARFPVTVAQFAAFVEATGHRTTAEERGSACGYTGSQWEDIQGASWAHPRGPDSDVRQKQDHPVTCVSWLDAQAFCRWASSVIGTEIRLPSEAEWEKAARGTDGRIWPWGNETPTKDHCNFAGNVGDTTPVGKYPKGASPYGVLDMAGNVWEWTASKYVNRTRTPPTTVGRTRRAAKPARCAAGRGTTMTAASAARTGTTSTFLTSGTQFVGFRVLSPGFRS